jgi:hypothetical protein
VRKYPVVLVLFAFVVTVSGCASGSNTSDTCNMAGFIATQHAHANRAEVTLCGIAAHVRSVRRTRSGAHRVFEVNVGRANEVEIDANVDVMGNFPIHTGDKVVVRGEYYYDGDGREGVHWTHHAIGGPHQPGFIVVNGQRYQ